MPSPVKKSVTVSHSPDSDNRSSSRRMASWTCCTCLAKSEIFWAVVVAVSVRYDMAVPRLSNASAILSPSGMCCAATAGLRALSSDWKMANPVLKFRHCAARTFIIAE